MWCYTSITLEVFLVRVVIKSLEIIRIHSSREGIRRDGASLCPASVDPVPSGSLVSNFVAPHAAQPVVVTGAEGRTARCGPVF